MSYITVDLRSRKQLSEQLIDNVKELILRGELVPDDKLPSVRSLAKELGINPNTIQKAYSELERSGVIVTLQGRGSIVAADEKSLRGEKSEQLKKKLAALVKEAACIGMTHDEFFDCAERSWCEDDNN